MTKNDENAFIMSVSDYRSILETIYLNQSPTNVRHLESSLKSFENKRT
ncbi:type II toxin-antitoxin system Phd/YefM family antitoxin [Staphylococcus pasteuri]